MKKNMKYIKIEGVLKSRGEYCTSPAEYRPYEAVTIVDGEGDEIHFHTLSISKRMDESVDFNKSMTFYILRYRVKDKMIGVLYALEFEGKKIFYPDTAIPELKSLGLQVRKRNQFITDPAFLMGIMILGGGLLALALCLGLGFDYKVAMLLGFGCMGLYLFSPFIFQAKGAGLSEMKKILVAEGFNVTSRTNSKY